MIILDTDVCIEILRGNEDLTRVLGDMDEIRAIAFMTYGELLYGAYNSKKVEYNISLVTAFIDNLFVIENDLKIMDLFGRIKSGLRRSGSIIPDADLLIAATALSNDCTLLTGNVSHFRRISSLIVKDWRS
tara:strand:- start:3485 stop:3877 length:393 start_codon:yes stop_codon:yes gene_type:complete